MGGPVTLPRRVAVSLLMVGRHVAHTPAERIPSIDTTNAVVRRKASYTVGSLTLAEVETPGPARARSEMGVLHTRLRPVFTRLLFMYTTPTLHLQCAGPMV